MSTRARNALYKVTHMSSEFQGIPNHRLSGLGYCGSLSFTCRGLFGGHPVLYSCTKIRKLDLQVGMTTVRKPPSTDHFERLVETVTCKPRPRHVDYVIRIV
jgi:hypothetical protein